MVQMELQPLTEGGSPCPDMERFAMTPGQALEIIHSLSRAAKDVLKGQAA